MRGNGRVSRTPTWWQVLRRDGGTRAVGAGHRAAARAPRWGAAFFINPSRECGVSKAARWVKGTRPGKRQPLTTQAFPTWRPRATGASTTRSTCACLLPQVTGGAFVSEKMPPWPDGPPARPSVSTCAHFQGPASCGAAHGGTDTRSDSRHQAVGPQRGGWRHRSAGHHTLSDLDPQDIYVAKRASLLPVGGSCSASPPVTPSCSVCFQASFAVLIKDSTGGEAEL